MTHAIRRKQPPPLPKRVKPGYGNLTQIDNPVLRRILQLSLDRLSKTDQELQDLKARAIQVGSPVNVYSQRVINVAEAKAPDDAVPLWQLRRVMGIEASRRQRQVREIDDDNIDDSGSNPPTVPLPNMFGEVSAYAAAHPAELANSCIAHGGGSWDYLDGLVAHLRATAPEGERIGYNGKRGNPDDPSEDVVTYWHGPLPPVAGEPHHYTIDVISCHCPEPASGCEPGPAWGLTGLGRCWLPVRP